MRYITKKDLYIVAQYHGKIMQGIGLVILLPIIVSLIYQEHATYLGFIIPSLISLGLGTLLTKINAKHGRVRLKHAMIVSSLAWLWGTFVGALVMYICLGMPFIDAFFENMSAWTGTGFTMFTNVEILPHSILFLRSLEQWVGGLGIVIIMIGVLIHSGTAASRLYKSEAREERIKPSVANTLKKIFQIYLIYTAIGIILFVIAGMPIFDAVNHTFTALSTGGMSIKNANMGYYHNDIFYCISMLMMIIGATSFLTHYKMIKTRGRSIFKDAQFIVFITLIILSTIVIVAATKVMPMEVLYHVVSGITTTGANIDSSVQMAAWPGFMKIIIIVLMIIGGTAGSTAGGIKIIRVIAVLKGIYKNITNIISPEGRVVNIKISNRELKDSSIREAGSYVSLYLVFLLLGWLVLVFYGYDAIDSLLDMSSAQSTVGLTTGIMGPAMPLGAKLMTIFNMWIGRLEIIPVLIVFRSIIEIFKVKSPKKAF